MSVIERCAQIKRDSGLDVVWIQVGHFFETYGDVALELSKKLGLALSQRNGVPKVGFPATHTGRWFDRTSAAGYSVGLAYQERSGGFRLQRNLGITSKREIDSRWNSPPKASFLETGSLDALGIRANGPLKVNEVFKLPTDRPGDKWRMVCSNSGCLHDSKYVECVTENSQGKQVLGLTSAEGLIIYPQAW